MSTRETGIEFERLRTDLEELNNALSRVIDILRDESLSETERIQRAVTIVELSQLTGEAFVKTTASG